MLADALGHRLRFIITAGQVGDVTTAPALLDGLAGGAVLADKAYDSNAFRRQVASLGAAAVSIAARLSGPPSGRTGDRVRGDVPQTSTPEVLS